MNENISEIIHAKLTASLAPEYLSIINESHKHAGHKEAPATGNSHFAVTIVSSKFINQGLRQRHTLVYQALDGMIGGQIHALSIVARTPEEEQSQ